MIAQLNRPFVRVGAGRVLVRLVSYAMFEGRPVTTRGRFLNPLVLAHLSRAAKRGEKTPVKRPIFIVGLGRSGTTLLGTIFATHPQVGFLNEPKAMWHTASGNEDVIGSYSRAPGRLVLTKDDATPETTARLRAMFSRYLAVTRSKRLVDKYPELAYRPDFVDVVFPDACYVVVQRDAGPAMASIEEWSRTHASESADWWGVDSRKWSALYDEVVMEDPAFSSVRREIPASCRDEPVRAAVEWIAATRAGLEILRTRGPRATAVDYDELVRRPRQTVSALLRAVGLDACNSVLDYAEAVVRPSARTAPPPKGLPPTLAQLLQATQEQLSKSQRPSAPGGGDACAS